MQSNEHIKCHLLVSSTEIDLDEWKQEENHTVRHPKSIKLLTVSLRGGYLKFFSFIENILPW